MKKRSIVLAVIAAISFDAQTLPKLLAQEQKHFQSSALEKQKNIESGSHQSAPFYRSRIFKTLAFAGTAIALREFADGTTDKEYGVEQDFKPFGLPKTLSNIGEVYDEFGSKRSVIALSGSALAGGLAFGDKKLRETSILIVASLAGTMGITMTGKRIFGRTRPYKEVGPHDFNFLKFSAEHQYQSFPSGHTSSVFAMVTVVAKQYPKTWVKVPAYLMGVSVAMQRIVSRNHWVSDTFVGGSLGYFVASFAVKYNKNRQRPLALRPLIAPNRLGALVSF